jgi:AraC-like DNA-binding protein
VIRRGRDVAAPLVASLAQFMAAQGLPAERLLGEVGIDPAALRDPDGRLPVDQYASLMAAAVAASGDPAFGLRFGQAARPKRWGVLGYISATCRNLGEAIRVQNRYQLLVAGLGDIHFTLYPDHARLEWRTESPAPRALADEEVAGWVAFARDVTGLDESPRSVHFAYPVPAERAAYDAFFGVPVRFGESWNGLTVHLHHLALPLRSADPTRHADWQRHAEYAMSRLGAPGTPLAALAAFLDQALPEHEPTLDAAAAALGLSPRTLQRRLSEAGRTYTGFIDALRRERALQWVAVPERSLTEIAFLLGFSEQSAFHRAFKRWTGMAPSHYRRAKQAATRQD